MSFVCGLITYISHVQCFILIFHAVLISLRLVVEPDLFLSWFKNFMDDVKATVSGSSLFTATSAPQGGLTDTFRQRTLAYQIYISIYTCIYMYICIYVLI